MEFILPYHQLIPIAAQRSSYDNECRAVIFSEAEVSDDGLETFGEAINKAAAVTLGSKIQGAHDVLFKIHQEKAQQKVTAGPMGGVNGIL